MTYYPKHYCGVFGVFGHPNAAELTYYGLRGIQHRGQESAGIATLRNGSTLFEKRLGMGLVQNIFRPRHISQLRGVHGIGHTRYSTTGSSKRRNAQPIVGTVGNTNIALGHNGNLTNTDALKDELRDTVSFQTDIDSEVILHLLAQAKGASIEDSLARALHRLHGAYSLVLLTPTSLIGVRDPHGFRPLSIGQKDGAWVLASETCAFDHIGATFVRDVLPGVIVTLDATGIHSLQAFPLHTERAFCIFEFVYFARPDSTIAGRIVYEVRVNMGRELFRQYPIQADMVIPIPDGGTCQALGYAEDSGIHYEPLFIRNHYVGRSFLQPSQLIRDLNVRMKLNLIRKLVNRKRVIIIDDSIVRGTTCRGRVNTLKEAGASEVHVLVSCPPHMHPCFYGIDFPDRSKLLAVQKGHDEIRRYLNADSLGYLSKDGMVRATGLPPNSFCTGCFTGRYPELPVVQQL